jgi:gamma-glutamyltranspeptidase/glutathione hydrolase
VRRCPVIALCIIWAFISLPAFGFEARHAVVVAEAELAARAGASVLERGGNAIDAAAATALAAGVVNPVSCGIGGGGFMLIYIAAAGKVYALDYRERAPGAVTQSLFVRDGRPDEGLLRQGPLSIAVPGELAGLAQALRRFGRMRFADAAKPAIELARSGFPCDRHLAKQIARHRAALAAEPGLRELFLHPDGSPRQAGERIVEPALARTLERLGNDPAEEFYHGDVARELVAELKRRGAKLSFDDLARYTAVWRAPLHHVYAKRYEVFSMPPPSAGGGLLLEMLGILDGIDLTRYSPYSAPYLELLARVMHQAFGDRAMYGDPDFVTVPLDFLLSAKHIGRLRQNALAHGPALPAPPHADHGTSDLCVVDAEGNVVSLTTTINTSFGAKLMAAKLGIILNDEMDDFALAHGVTNVFGLLGYRRDLIAPGKRPLSSMAPTIVMDEGHRPLLAIGASGGPTIATSILQVTLDILNFGLDPQPAVIVPRVYAQEVPDQVVLEDTIPPAVVSFFIEQGYQTRRFTMLGDVSAVLIKDGRLYAGADPRKYGGAAGY